MWTRFGRLRRMGAAPAESCTRVVVAAFIVGLLAGCGEFRPMSSDYHFLRHKVQAGDTLYSIAFRFGYDFREVAAWNNIHAPYNIWPGEELLIMTPQSYRPEDAYRPIREQAPRAAPQSTLAANTTSVTAPSPGTRRPPAPVSQPQAGKAKPELTAGREVTAIKWSWPTAGKVVNRFAAALGRKGLDLGGKVGQPVRAAADGEVVYSGKGLIGYGNLVIIKHDEIFLSAYGHNRKLLVKEGSKVRGGQVIGEMGQNPKTGSILHFEIRRNGKPVDPLLYLPNKTP